MGCGDDSGGPVCDGGACGDAGPQPCMRDEECVSGDCANGVCVEPSCTGDGCPGDECSNDDECMNGDCVDGRCTGIAECSDDEDCADGVCADGICLDATCEDGVANGSETAEDCGGSVCGGCLGEDCGEGEDCASQTCIRSKCAPATCTDARTNQDETDEDCGGPVCARCVDHEKCVESSDCQSLKCIDDECAEPTCDDSITNGSETDEDCGGEGGCERCARGDRCEVDDDCETMQCADTCVTAPVAGFVLSTVTPDRGDKVIATSTATDADRDIELIEYDWGDGFEELAWHQFEEAGEHTVTQRITDENGLSDTTELELTVSAFRPVRLSETDKIEHVVISDDGLVATQLNFLSFDAGVRSDTGIAPGSGAFYFEATQLGQDGYYGFGVSTAAADLTMQLGTTVQSWGVNTIGHTTFNNVFSSIPQSDVTGFVIDYRTATPVVHIVSNEPSAVPNGAPVPTHRALQALTAVTTPLFATYAGTCENQGPAVSFNFGSDTTNHPFAINAVSALTAAGHAALAAALVRGFGQTRARAASTAPDLDVPGDMSIAAGTEVTLEATAMDAEDGDITAKIEWVNLATSMFDREEGTGESFTFTPPEVGRYPIQVTVRDAFNVVSQHTVMIEATGELPQFDPVRLVEDQYSGDGITLSSDGLQAAYSVSGKMGVHANQGNYGRFWYFEQSRLVSSQENIGGGLTIARGSLNPMHFETMHPSAQINFQGSLWHGLVHEFGLDAVSYYGWAVDYRGVNPIVHIIVENELVYTMTLGDVWVPIYPQLYGDPTANAAPFDNEINFGATPFHNNPVTALSNAVPPVSTAGLEVGWGDANIP